MPHELRPLNTSVGVAAHHEFNAAQLAQLLAIAAPDPTAELIPMLERDTSVGIRYVVPDLVERVVARHGSAVLERKTLPPVTDLHRELVAYGFRFEHPLQHHEPGREELEPLLREGLAFLFDVEHPERPRVCSHHGKSWRLNHHRRYTFAPQALGQHGGAVVVVDADGGWNSDGLAEGELARLGELLAELGAPVKTTWNGAHRGITGSIGIARAASESLLRNVYGDRR